MCLSDTTKGALIVVSYVLAVFLTYGYYVARREPSGKGEELICSVFWPVYWMARLAIVAGDSAIWIFTPTTQTVE